MSIFKKMGEVRRQAFSMSNNGKIFIEADDIFTFVGRKDNDIWIWLAYKRRTWISVGDHIGKRDDDRASAILRSPSECCKKM